ncbi:MAG: hypothetical protein AAF694_10545 [Bacteroidota bacterium]
MNLIESSNREFIPISSEDQARISGGENVEGYWMCELTWSNILASLWEDFTDYIYDNREHMMAGGAVKPKN